MTSGRPITRADQLRVWRMVASGCHDLRMVAQRTQLSWLTVRAIVLDACTELVQRIDIDRRNEELDRLSDPH